MAYAENTGAKRFLLASTSGISPQARTQVDDWNRRRDLQIRIWTGADIEQKLRVNGALQIKYGLESSASQSRSRLLLPVAEIQLKYSNAIASALAFSSKISAVRRNCFQAISELMKHRIYCLKSNIDLFSGGADFASLDDLLEEGSFNGKTRLDSLGVRVVLLVFLDAGNLQRCTVKQLQRGVEVVCPAELKEITRQDLVDVANLSNFSIGFQPSKFTLEPVEK